MQIASVDWRRPEGLISICILISTGVLLLGLITGHTGRILDSGVILMSHAILQ